LDRGEKLLWEGAPRAGLRFRGSDIFLSLFGCFFFAFAVFWMYMASGAMGAPGGIGLVFPLFGLPFVAVGFYLMVGRFFWDSFVRSKTRYALTNKRAIVASSAWGRKLRSWPIHAGTRLEFEPGDEATIWFAEEVKRGSKGRTYTTKHGFEYVEGGDELYRLMRRVQQGESV
jgi:hypothetical protein